MYTDKYTYFCFLQATPIILKCTQTNTPIFVSYKPLLLFKCNTDKYTYFCFLQTTPIILKCTQTNTPIFVSYKPLLLF